jgi:uncharacterized membrane protein YbhN (UPF0104 family)
MSLSRTRTWIPTLTVVAISLALLAWLLTQIRFADLARLATRLTVLQVLAIVMLYLAATVFRGIRLGLILQDRRYGTLTAVSGVHAFLNHILPFRSGELSLPLLVRTFMNQSLASGAISLVLVRLYDTLSIALLMLLSLAMVGADLESRLAASMACALLILTGLLLAAFGALPLLLRTAGRVLPVLGRLFGARGVEPAARLVAATVQMQGQLTALGALRRYLWIPLTSLLTQTAIYAFFYVTMRGMGIDIGFFKNMLASSGEMITGLLPINMVGSIGTLEAGWAVGYVLCGVSRVDAIASGFIVHGLIIVSGFAISVAGIAYLAARRRLDRCPTQPPTREPPPPEP